MRTILFNTLIAISVVIICAFGTDSSIGTWKLNLNQSMYGPAPLPVKTLTVTREASNGGVKVTTTGERADGTPLNASYTTQFVGHPSIVTGSGAPFDTITIKRVNPNTFNDERTKTGGCYRAKGQSIISDGGKVMTTTFEGTGADGKPFKAVFVYEKQ